MTRRDRQGDIAGKGTPQNLLQIALAHLLERQDSDTVCETFGEVCAPEGQYAAVEFVRTKKDKTRCLVTLCDEEHGNEIARYVFYIVAEFDEFELTGADHPRD